MNSSMPSFTGSLQIWSGVVQGWGLSLYLMALLAILDELMAGHTLQPIFLVPKFQLFPTLVIPRRFLHGSWDSESCSYCSLSLEPFSLLSWSRTLDELGACPRALSSGVNFFGVYHLQLTFFVSPTSQHWLDS